MAVLEIPQDTPLTTPVPAPIEPPPIGNALVTGADRGLGLALTGRLLAKGWHVFAGQYMPDWPELDHLGEQYPKLTCVHLDVTDDASVLAAAQTVGQQAEHIDLVINNAGVLAKQAGPIREAQNYEEMMGNYRVNTLGPLRVVEAFLPLTTPSALKRLCFISSEAGSINGCARTNWYGYCMSKTALNMGIRILFNLLRPEGYTFRVYHPGWMRSYMMGSKSSEGDLEPEEAAVPALAYFVRNRSDDAYQPGRSDENRLVMRDYLGREWPW